MSWVDIRRFDPLDKNACRTQRYQVSLAPGMSVLNLLEQIYSEQDETLAYSRCCRAGVCGLCAVMVNGKPRLACRTAASPEMLLEPLRGFPVRKDLLIDREAYEAHRSRLHLYLERQSCRGAVLRYVQSVRSQKDSQQRLLADEVRAYIAKTMAEGVTVNAVADHFHYNSNYLSHLVKQETGQPLEEVLAHA